MAEARDEGLIEHFEKVTGLNREDEGFEYEIRQAISSESLEKEEQILSALGFIKTPPATSVTKKSGVLPPEFTQAGWAARAEEQKED